MLGLLEKFYQKKELASFGVYLNDIHSAGKGHRFFICLLRGVMVFLACYGTLVGIVDAFEIPYNKVAVSVFIFAISFFMTFLYINKVFFYVGYFALLFFFTRFLIQFYLLANSGYQAVVNEIYSAYSDYFDLASVRQAQEFVSNRYLSVTVAMLFVAVFLAMLLNVTISGYMNLPETVLVTFPLIEVAFYINRRPPLYCIIMLLAVYICVGILQASKYSRMQVKGRKTKEYARIRTKKKTIYLYQGHVKGNLIILIASLIFSAVICILSSGLYFNENEAAHKNAIRKKMDDYVKTFVQTGFTGFLNRYESTGGLSRGRLGGVSSVRPDFETDLIVTYAPDYVGTFYLRSYVGSLYHANNWQENAYIIHENDPLSEKQPLYDFLMSQDEITIKEHAILDTSGSMGLIRVENVDAEEYYHYLPYVTSEVFTTLQNNLTFPVGKSETLTYYPLPRYEYPVKEDVLLSDPVYSRYVNECCLYVPDFLSETLTNYCLEKEYPGILLGGINQQAYDEYEDVNEYRLAVANAIHADFVQNYPYTMSPGATPINDDFIEYFLTKQKRGYCVHFASTAVMLLRTMGVPARYVEGYCVPPSLLSEAGEVLSEENYSDWFNGDSYFPENVVVKTEVSDAYAHAWIEIYLEGYGFVPFEMTPPSFETDELGFGDLTSLLQGLFGRPMDFGNLPETDLGNSDIGNPENSSRFNFSFLSSQSLLLPVIYIILAILFALSVYLIVRVILTKKRYQNLLAAHKFRELTYDLYAKVKKELCRQKKDMNPHSLPMECKEILNDLLLDAGIKDYTKYDAYFQKLEEIMYGEKESSLEEYNAIKKQTEELLPVIKNPSRLLKS